MNDPQRGPLLQNRLPAEGINSSDEHPLKEFAWLVGASVGCVLVLVALFAWGARWLAPHVPFSVEERLAARLVDRPEAPEHFARSAALQALAERVAAQLGVPQNMRVLVRYDDSPVANAYATVGGRIRVFRGLLTQLRSEDAVSALLAHEIAHVEQRHVAANLGRGLAIGLVLTVVSTDAGAAAAQGLLGNAAGLAMLGYSREQESHADAAALRAVVGLYGHAGGITELFSALHGAAPGGTESAEFLRSHPLTDHRTAALRDHAERAGWALSGKPTAMPTALVLTPSR
jgi:Zn-dependent protease with chaperone function